MAGDVLRYLVGNAVELMLNIEDPYAVDLGESVLDDVYLGVTVYTGYGLPSFIDASGDGDVRLGADVSVNLRGISNLAEGLSGGTVVRAGVVAANVPYGSMPGVMTGNEHMTNDLWLFRLFLYPGAHQAPA